MRKRLFAWIYHEHLSGQGHPNMDDPMTRYVKVPLLSRARGDVLEIGAGDGDNIPLFPTTARLTLLEPNVYLLPHIAEVAQRTGRQHWQIVRGTVENLPFEAAVFDAVVSTHVLCSVRDQGQALAEVMRVLRPGGLFLFLEHVRAAPHTRRYLNQRLINPVWRWIGDGCHLTRDTGAAIETAGFARVNLRAFEADYPGIVKPHITGVAVSPPG